MNQYWYSAATIDTMVAEIEKVAKRVAFLSTPSIYFSLKNEELRRNSKLFDVSYHFAFVWSLCAPSIRGVTQLLFRVFHAVGSLSCSLVCSSMRCGRLILDSSSTTSKRHVS